MFQSLIAQVSGLEAYKALILTKSAGIRSWQEMLSQLIETQYHDATTLHKLKGLYKRIDELGTERNSIVHAAWRIHEVKEGLRKGAALPPQEHALGLGIPKRGKNIVTDVVKTAAEMRLVAKKIQTAREQLLDIVNSAMQKGKSRNALAKLLASTT